MGRCGHAEEDCHVGCPLGVGNMNVELDLWTTDLTWLTTALGWEALGRISYGEHKEWEAPGSSMEFLLIRQLKDRTIQMKSEKETKIKHSEMYEWLYLFFKKCTQSLREALLYNSPSLYFLSHCIPNIGKPHPEIFFPNKDQQRFYLKNKTTLLHITTLYGWIFHIKLV